MGDGLGASVYRVPDAGASIHVEAGLEAQRFEDHVVSRGIYETAWDGTLVMEVWRDAAIRLVDADTAPTQ
jgi:hypothetical protein